MGGGKENYVYRVSKNQKVLCEQLKSGILSHSPENGRYVRQKEESLHDIENKAKLCVEAPEHLTSIKHGRCMKEMFKATVQHFWEICLLAFWSCLRLLVSI